MKKLLLSFVLTLLSAQNAYATAEKGRVNYSINLIKAFQADNVDNVINSSVGKIGCEEGVKLPKEVSVESVGRAPAYVPRESKLKIFRELVEKSKFRKNFNEQGDIYLFHTSSTSKIFNIEVQRTEYLFSRKSKTKDEPFVHEHGLSEAKVKEYLLDLIDRAESNYQVEEKAFSFKVGNKAYLINLDLPLLANPVYKQDVTNGNMDYGFSGVIPRDREPQLDTVSMTK